jgi:hypothetical protein
VQGARFEENIRFVKQKHGFPDGSDVEDAGEVLFELRRIRAELA